jgi:methyl-accepting chemotaxis protein
MTRIKTKLGVLIAVTLVAFLGLASWMISREQQAYNGLANFKTTTEISSKLYDYTQALTAERYAAIFGINLMGETSPQEQVATFRKAMEKSIGLRDYLLKEIEANKHAFSASFGKAVVASLKRDAVLKPTRDFILDPGRPLVPEDRGTVSGPSNTNYDLIRAELENIFPTMVLETEEAGAVRLINLQETISRMKGDLWRVRGLVSATLRRNRVNGNNIGIMISRRENIAVSIARIESLADSPRIRATLKKVTGSEPYKTILDYAQQIQRIGPDQPNYMGISSLEAYQTGAYAQIEPVYEELITVVNEEMNAFTAARLASAKTRLQWLYSAVTVMVVVLTGLILYISASITRPLVRVSHDLAQLSHSGLHVARTMGEASGRLSRDSSEEAATIEEISASVEEMSGTTKQNLANIKEAAALTQRARESADKGAGIVASLRVAMNSSEKANKDIANIIKTIEDIAFQTKMLALNAAVEAARAGSAGAGFSVVAEEVRNLAQRCADAVNETSGKVTASLANSAESADYSRRVESSFQEILEITHQYAAKFSEIETASLQGADGIQQIGQAIIRLDQITQNTAALAEENAGTSTEMVAQANRLIEQVDLLETMASTEHVGAAATTDLPAPTKPSLRAELENGVPRQSAGQPADARAKNARGRLVTS